MEGVSANLIHPIDETAHLDSLAISYAVIEQASRPDNLCAYVPSILYYTGNIREFNIEL
jgi:hypothetical protein